MQKTTHENSIIGAFFKYMFCHGLECIMRV